MNKHTPTSLIAALAIFTALFWCGYELFVWSMR
jgi:hypothetical protein